MSEPILSLEAALSEDGLVPPELVERAKLVGVQTGTPLTASLTRLGLLPEEELAAWLTEKTDVRRWRLSDSIGTPDLPPDANLSFLEAKRSLFLRDGKNHWHVAVTDPTDTELLKALEFVLGKEPGVLVGTEADIVAGLAQLGQDYGTQKTTQAQVGIQSNTSESDDISLLHDLKSDAPAIRAVNKIISDAVDQRASDIHIEPLERSVVVRYRADGLLREVLSLSQNMASAMVSRIKVMAKLDIAEKRLPQDGRVRTSIRGQNVDLRISTAPTIYGESVVMRILGRSTAPLDLRQLGLPDAAVAPFEAALGRPNGIILVTGPTGSGKTTNLYAALNRLHQPDTKILTVEDPIEYLMPGINQVQVKPEIGLTYATALRSFLRQDPDVMMVGEIRDKETADIAIRAALTGHLVLSTLHTNSAIGAVTRLIDMGVEPFLISNTLILTAGQRLVRKLCQSCRKERALEPTEQALFDEHLDKMADRVFDPVGCPRCQQTGFSGRIPIMECVPMDGGLAQLMREGASEAAMTRYTADRGHKGLMADGLARAAVGLTTITEVKRVALNTDT